MKKRTAILAGLGVGAAALAVLGKKMLQNEERSAIEKEPDAPCNETEQIKEETPQTDTVTALSVCYYTPKSVVWHADRDCFYIKTAAEIHSGSIESAIMAGKGKPCARCGQLHSAE